MPFRNVVYQIEFRGLHWLGPECEHQAASVCLLLALGERVVGIHRLIVQGKGHGFKGVLHLRCSLWLCDVQGTAQPGPPSCCPTDKRGGPPRSACVSVH